MESFLQRYAFFCLALRSMHLSHFQIPTKNSEPNSRGMRAVGAFHFAVGEQRGQVKFWRSRFSKSSSVLPMADVHKLEFPWSSELVPIYTRIAALDDFLHDIELVPKVLLKIDVQGYEDRVIRGGIAILRNVDYILTEVSFRLPYEGQTSFDDLYELLKQLGFSYAGNVDQLLSAADGSVLQADALFVRDTASIPKHTISA